MREICYMWDDANTPKTSNCGKVIKECETYATTLAVQECPILRLFVPQNHCGFVEYRLEKLDGLPSKSDDLSFSPLTAHQ